MKTAHQRAESATGHEADHLHPKSVDACGFGGQLVLLDREHRQAEPRTLHQQRDQKHRRHERHTDQCVDPGIGKLHELERLIAMHRKRQFLPTHPVENEDEQQGVGQHRQRKIMAAQTESDRSDHQAGEASDEGSGRQPDPGRNAEFDRQQCDGEGAHSKKRRVAKGNQPRVAAEQVPGERKGGPDRNGAEDELVVRIADKKRCTAHEQRDDEDHPQRRALEGTCQHHVRSALRPKRPCGRSSTTTRNRMKMVAFCS